MASFTYGQPTEIWFGRGRIQETGKAAWSLGKRCLLVTGPVSDARRPQIDAVTSSLRAAGLAVAHFDGVVPNPTTESITAGAGVAREHKADVVVGLGGGSSMDSAKAIAVESTHEGSAWDYLFFK
ncbi:MAG TPA: iron-containing alcohol dehydrogenase, partial [Spirochaetia bacterium]|nr:iron-containing alcohol dehydrogenase [Spirochaetia bacterium]